MEEFASSEPLVSCQWLRENLERKDILIADCRYNLFDHNLGTREYNSSHIPNAYFINMEKDLTGSVSDHGGRHPLPNTEAFAESMNRIGLTGEKTVIAYDSDGSGAARLWWLLKYFGHDQVRILNGGFPMWAELGYPVTRKTPQAQHGNFVPTENKALIIYKDDLKRLRHGSKIIDSRDRERYAGEVEPIDKKAGHIPGAINVPYKEVMQRPGLFKTRDEISGMFTDAGEDPILYCGSGITSCVNFVALAYVGKKAKLYAGSWSDWISYEDSEIATGHNP